MTVKELIEQLEKVEDKEVPVLDYEYDEVTLVVINSEKERVLLL